MKYNVIINIDVYVDDVEAESKEEAMMVARAIYDEHIATAEVMEVLIDKEYE